MQNQAGQAPTWNKKPGVRLNSGGLGPDQALFLSSLNLNLVNLKNYAGLPVAMLLKLN